MLTFWAWRGVVDSSAGLPSPPETANGLYSLRAKSQRGWSKVNNYIIGFFFIQIRNGCRNESIV